MLSNVIFCYKVDLPSFQGQVYIFCLCALHQWDLKPSVLLQRLESVIDKSHNQVSWFQIQFSLLFEKMGFPFIYTVFWMLFFMFLWNISLGWEWMDGHSTSDTSILPLCLAGVEVLATMHVGKWMMTWL